MALASIGNNLGNRQFLNPGQQQKLLGLQTYTSLMARTFKPDDVPSIKSMHQGLLEQIVSTAKKAQARASDLTRTQHANHLLAREDARTVGKAVMRYKELFAAKAEKLISEGNEAIDDVLGRNTVDRQEAEEILAWVQQSLTTGGERGIAAVSAAYKKDHTVASVIYTRKPFVLGVTDALHANMKEEAAKKFSPEGYASLSEGKLIARKLKGFDAILADAHASFYDASVAETAEVSVVE